MVYKTQVEQDIQLLLEALDLIAEDGVGIGCYSQSQVAREAVRAHHCRVAQRAGRVARGAPAP